MPKFMQIVERVKKVKFNLPSAIELSETADFVYNFVFFFFASIYFTRMAR